MATPTGTKVDAERARLRAEGYTEAEISQILINQASGTGSQQPAGAAPVQGNMTGVLGNASAVLSHARGTIPVLKGEVANLSDPTASRKSRAKSAVILACGALLVVVLAYAINQEWNQHIIYENINASEQALAAHAQNCLNRGTIGFFPDTLAYKQWKKDCPDFVGGSATPATTSKGGKDEYDALSNADVLSELKNMDQKFNEITHSNASEDVRACTYRQALRLMGKSGYDEEGALRAAAPDCLAHGRPAEGKP